MGVGNGDFTDLVGADVVAGEPVKAGEKGYSSCGFCQCFFSRMQVWVSSGDIQYLPG